MSVTVQEVIDALCFRPDTYISAPFENLADRIRTYGIAPPEGMRLVPIEPTAKMIEAGIAAITIDMWRKEICLLVYKAMLTAAPKQENSND